MNNLIAFTREEAEITLQHIYNLFEDQILDPVALGGVSGRITEGAERTLQASFDFNPFFTGLMEEMKMAPKFLTNVHPFVTQVLPCRKIRRVLRL